MSKVYTHAVAMQRMAANPQKSVFVSANAGSGKTRVLVDRVSRLLLAGTEPDKILALTYTRAAASEMQARLFEALGKWSILGTEDLNAKLNLLQNQTGQRSRAEIGRARQLFAKALETPGGLKVQTIHAFCEKLLRQFPIEAGLAPGVESIDERDAKVLQAQIIETIERDIVENPDTELAREFTILATHLSNQAIDDIYSFAMGSLDKISAWTDAGGIAPLMDFYGIKDNVSAEDIKVAAWNVAPRDEIETAARDALKTTSRFIERAEFSINALKESDPLTAYDLYCQSFFGGKGKGDLFKPPMTKNAPIAGRFYGCVKDEPSSEAKRLIEVQDKIKATHALMLTRAVYHLCVRASDAYRAAKTKRQLIDFNDQIEKARALLMDSMMRDWVRYKLDGGVDHILVDEAQDTSAKQWKIVNALAEEFFQPSPDADPRKRRTLFAVGDEKQSIYSFQGAKPELFLQEMQSLSVKQADTPEVRMDMSFRSSSQILSLVDAIFYEHEGIQDTFDPKRLPIGSDKGEHNANRDDAGLIELWPLAPKPQTPEKENPSKPVPVDTPDQNSAPEKLAAAIAVQIKTWLDEKEPINVREGADGTVVTRPMRPSDIMILVKGRQQFFDGLIRHLKMKGVPVSGADRLKLTESIAVQDMLSLAKFVLNSCDDLSLAEVLKSPIVGWTDQQLEDVAYCGTRQSSLWDALPAGSDRDFLGRIKTLASRYAPYEFFARTLALVPAGKTQSIKGLLLARLGGEILDALDAFLEKALAHQRRGAPSLMAFVRDVSLSEDKVKRELDVGSGEVRVMTVYGAKGLEAPIVILPDTSSVPDTKHDILLAHNDGYALKLSEVDRPAALTKLVENRVLDKAREDMRLLYVALTRAENRLLICGYAVTKDPKPGSWHRRIETVLDTMDSQSIDTPFGEGARFGQQGGEVRAPIIKTKESRALPDWARTSIQSIEKSPRHKSPSRLTRQDEGNAMSPAVQSPLRSQNQRPDRFARGNYIHKLLETLPDIAPQNRKAALDRYFQMQNVDSALARDVEAIVFSTLNNPGFAKIFGPNSSPEVTLAGTIDTQAGPLRLSGQIDRLCVFEGEVLIIDYKSNRPPPKTAQDVDKLYIRQMAAYKKLVQSLYPAKSVRAFLLWADRAHLMELPPSLLDGVDWAKLAH